MFLIVLISSVSATVDWIQGDVADSLYGLLIYNGNINITFDGDFSINNSGFDTNESVRMENIVGTSCSAGDFIFNFSEDGTPQCDSVAAASDTNESVRFDILVGSDCSGTDKVIGVNSTGGVLCAADVDTNTNLFSGGTISGDLIIASPYKLTVQGELILQAIATVQNVTPVTHNLYALGNTTHWFNKLYATNIYNENFYGTNINASDINSTDIHSNNINSTTMEVNENITLAGHIIKKDGEDMILLLG